MNKWYMHNSESTLKNKMYKILWKFEIQTDQTISARRPDLVIGNNKKENLPNKIFYRFSLPQGKTERKR